MTRVKLFVGENLKKSLKIWWSMLHQIFNDFIPSAKTELSVMRVQNAVLVTLNPISRSL